MASHGTGSIARKLLRTIRKARGSKVVDLLAHATARQNADDLHETLVSPHKLAELGMSHGAYVYVQNVVSVLVEEMTTLPELSRFADVIEAADEEYSPEGPPESPLTRSHFTCWCFFDLAFGLRKETLGTITLTIGPEIGLHPEFLHILGLMQDSRMGIYSNEGTDDVDRVLLRELVLGTITPCFVPVSYRGDPGELWLARVMPPAAPGLDAVVFTTPYVLTRQGEDEWTAYFDRTLDSSKHRTSAYHALMKYGPERHYWNEYIFEAYVNHTFEAILLVGLPDVSTSRPHSPDYIRPPGFIKAW